MTLLVSLVTVRNLIYCFYFCRMLLKAVLKGITIQTLIGFVLALIKVDCTVSDLITNYLFMKPKETKHN